MTKSTKKDKTINSEAISKEKTIPETINVTHETKLEFERERSNFRFKEGQNLTQDSFLKHLLDFFKGKKWVSLQVIKNN